MTRISTLAAINAAELRFVQSRRNVRQSVDRTQSALRAAIARPSTLVLVAVASGISTFLLSHRLRPSVKNVMISADSTVKASSRSLVRTLVSLYGAQVLTYALQYGTAAWKKCGSRVSMPSTSATGDTATTRHDSSGPLGGQL